MIERNLIFKILRSKFNQLDKSFCLATISRKRTFQWGINKFSIKIPKYNSLVSLFLFGRITTVYINKLSEGITFPFTIVRNVCATVVVCGFFFRCLEFDCNRLRTRFVP